MTRSPVFFNRLTDTWNDQPPTGSVFSSQIILQGPIELDREGFGGKVLLVDNEEGVTILQTESLRTSIPVIQGDRRDSLKAALDVADHMRQWRDLGIEWRELVMEVDPLILLADISELLKVDAIEATLSDNAPQLRSVFHSPFSELEFSAKRMPAPRARRFSRRAMQVLAARSEDWIRAGASGITPRTVEALVRDEVQDIYETRVAARLVDDVRRHLKGVLAVYSELQPLVQVIRGPYRKQTRLARLWGRLPPGDELRDGLRRRQGRIEGLLRLTEELRDSRLYEGVPRRARVSQPIRMTNLLVQDANYRAVRRLWIEWWQVRGQQGSPEDRRAQQLSEAEAFFDFALLTVSRALVNLEALRGADRPPPGDMAVSSPWGKVELERAAPFDEGTWRLSVSPVNAGRETYRGVVVALACEVLRGPASEVRQRIEQLAAEVAITGCQDVFVLVPATMHDYADIEPALQGAAGLDPIGGAAVSRRDLWIIPISPLDIESCERVERAVRWAVLSNSWLSYPPSITMPKLASDTIGEQPFVVPVPELARAEVIGIPSDRDLHQVRYALEQQARRCRQQLRGSGFVDAEQLDAVSASLDRACGRLGAISVCPVCGNEGQLAARSARTFEVRCRRCSSRWGLRHDPSSDHRIPYLWIGEDLTSLPTGKALSSWLGRDVMAEPCRHGQAEYGSDLINPWTGRCTGVNRLGATCDRCVVVGSAPPDGAATTSQTS